MSLQDFSNSSCTFSYLASELKNEDAQQKYIDTWQQKYAPVFKGKDERVIIEWDIRTSRALKGVFTSASFYVESLQARSNGSWASFYFLSYYSLFHAKLACLYLLHTETVESLVDITHTKIRNLFYSTYCNPKSNIVRKEIRDLFDVLKFSREYYSYQMPFNDFLESSEDISDQFKLLPSYLRCCYQLASLHSELVEAAYSKHGSCVRDTKCHKDYIYDTFLKVNASKHPLTNQYLIDPSDRFRLLEIFNGSAPTCFSINFEHYCDEFRTYMSGSSLDRESNKDAIDRDVREIWKFVYSAIS